MPLPAEPHPSANAPRHPWWVGLAAFLVWLVAWLLVRSLRLRVHGLEQIERLHAAGRPILYCFWHGRQLALFRVNPERPPRPPLVVLSGFLGSGKTSFLQHFIEYQTQRSRFVAVIQNEIGEVGLDGKLLDYTVTEIDEGCVCCSLVGNLKRAVSDILSDFQPDFIILETTGAANPLNLLDEISELEDLVRYDCTVTVVDSLNFDFTLSRFAIAVDQIRAADVLVLNKCDLVSDGDLRRVRKQIGNLNPKAIVFSTINGDLNPALIFETGDAGENKKIVSPTSGSTFHKAHVQDGLRCDTLTLSAPMDRGDFLSAVKSFPADVFRVKGIIEFTDSLRPMLFQYVAGRFELSVFPQQDIRDRFLTVISREESTNLDSRFAEVLKTAIAVS